MREVQAGKPVLQRTTLRKTRGHGNGTSLAPFCGSHLRALSHLAADKKSGAKR